MSIGKKKKDDYTAARKEASQRAAADLTKKQRKEFNKGLRQNGPGRTEITNLMQTTAALTQTSNKDEFVAGIPSVNGKIALYLSSIDPLMWISMTTAIADAYSRFGELEIATLKYESICEYAELRFADKKETFGDFVNLSKLYIMQYEYKKAAAAREKGLDLYIKAGLASQEEIDFHRNQINKINLLS